MYSIENYGAMITDNVRMTTYDEALRAAVTPDSVVLDIGTGIGMFALLACQYGARRVYAIEPTDAIEVAQELAEANGYGDRIQFIQGVSTAIDLPERADIIVFDLHGRLTFYEEHIPSVIDARRRFLAPGGHLIPQAEALSVALVEAPDSYHRCEVPWNDNLYNLDLRAAKKYVVNNWDNVRNETELLVPPSCWASIDFKTVENPNFGADLAWTVSRPGTAHGLNVWFDTMMVDGIGFSNAPDSTERCTVFGDGFFPLLEPVGVKEGDQVSLSLQANLVNGSYVWRWNTRIIDSLNPDQIKADFRQSTLLGEPLALPQMRKRDPAFTPSLKTEGQLRQQMLSLMDGTKTLEEIARRLADDFPDRYPTWQDALPEVGELSSRYSR